MYMETEHLKITPWGWAGYEMKTKVMIISYPESPSGIIIVIQNSMTSNWESQQKQGIEKM